MFHWPRQPEVWNLPGTQEPSSIPGTCGCSINICGSYSTDTVNFNRSNDDLSFFASVFAPEELKMTKYRNKNSRLLTPGREIRCHRGWGTVLCVKPSSQDMWWIPLESVTSDGPSRCWGWMDPRITRLRLRASQSPPHHRYEKPEIDPWGPHIRLCGPLFWDGSWPNALPKELGTLQLTV